MRRSLRLLLIGSLSLLAWSVAPSAPAGAAGAVVRVDLALARSISSECTNYPSNNSCNTTFAGNGLTLDGLRQWTLDLNLGGGRGCTAAPGGRWQLRATDGSGDGLGGTIWGNGTSYWPYRMTVDTGTGSYAGAVDANPNQVQQFSSLGVPSTPLLGGCDNSFSLGVLGGSLEFHLQ
jgi:hypothetical protein